MTVPITPENKRKCLCGTCRTYTYNGLRGRLFCSIGKSEKTPQVKGCVCPSCPVFIEYKLSGYYFCIKGAGGESSVL
ncbi:MAG: DUF2769 domain-containing protein [Halobacteriota archaeon]